MKEFRLVRQWKGKTIKSKWINQEEYTIKQLKINQELANSLSDNGEWFLEYREV